jgi:uncharacterized SAM-binding protein YcdF (DUF218 family)
MFILKKMLTSFFLAPGVFVVVLIVSGAWFLSRGNRGAGILNLLLGLLMWFLCLGPVGNSLVRGLESGFDIPARPTGDVILLLGAGVYDKAKDLTGTGAPSNAALSRLVTATRIQRILHVPIIVSGGKIYDFSTAEASILKRFLVDLGVPDHMVIIEDQSKDTIENAQNTAEICKRNGYVRPILVTSAYHMKRSVMSFARAGLNVLPFPAGFRSWENRSYGITDYLPSSLGTTRFALKEYLGLFVYGLFY